MLGFVIAAVLSVQTCQAECARIWDGSEVKGISIGGWDASAARWVCELNCRDRGMEPERLCRETTHFVCKDRLPPAECSRRFPVGFCEGFR